MSKSPDNNLDSPFNIPSRYIASTAVAGVGVAIMTTATVVEALYEVNANHVQAQGLIFIGASALGGVIAKITKR